MTNSISLIGVNLAGAEFGYIGGAYGSSYTYPTDAEIDYYASKAMNVIRLPFLWERLQPTLGGAFDSAELARMDEIVQYATSKGMKVILDPHDYGRYNGNLVGSDAVPNSAFADFWGKLAGHFAGNQRVIFGLMNEPAQTDATAWLASENAAIAAIRAAGATQEVLVQGIDYDGAWTWTSSQNAAVIGTGIKDSGNNYAFEVHQYLDQDGSGTNPNVVSTSVGVDRLTAVTQWAEQNKARLFLGEFGVASDQTSLTAMDSMLAYMEKHAGAWQGATYWAGGPWWGNYMYSIEPQNGADAAQMGVLARYAAPGDTVSKSYYNKDGSLYYTLTTSHTAAGSLVETYKDGSYFNGKPYNTLIETYDSSMTLLSAGYGGVTGQAYTSYVNDYDSSRRVVDQRYFGFTGRPYTGVVLTYATDHSLIGQAQYAGSTLYLAESISTTNGVTAQLFYAGTALAGKPYGSYELDYRNGKLIERQYLGFKNQPYSAYADLLDTTGHVASRITTMTNGSHVLRGFQDGVTLTSLQNDTMTGGGASETFLFNTGYGHDIVTDLAKHLDGAGHDTVSLAKGEFADFATLLGHTQTVGANAVITGVGGDQITLMGMTKQDLASHQGDFLFHA